MEKIPTLFVRDPANMKLVTREANPDAAWVLAGEGVPTVKRDGTNVRITVADGRLVCVEKRRNPSRAEKAQGAEPGYVEANRDDPADKHIFAAVDATVFAGWPPGAWPCEALGPKIQGGAEGWAPGLYPFAFRAEPLANLWPSGDPRTFDALMRAFVSLEIEGIVWHHPDGRMAKVKRRDFGLPWPVRP